MGRKIKPIEQKTDKTLVNIIKKTGDSAAYLELKKRNEKSFYKTASSYCKKVKYLNYEDIINNVDYVFTRAINSYSPHKKTLFNSWFTNHSRYFILNTIRQSSEDSFLISTENGRIDIINNLTSNFHTDQNKHLKEHIFNILDKIPDKRISKIYRLRFFSDNKTKKWKNISKKLKLSVQSCMFLYNQGAKILKKEFNK